VPGEVLTEFLIFFFDFDGFLCHDADSMASRLAESAQVF
jgi:hypothetical protein